MIHLAPLPQILGQADRLDPQALSVTFLDGLEHVFDLDHGRCSFLENQPAAYAVCSH
jgi:hypothetical protein